MRGIARPPIMARAFYEAVFGWRVDADRDDPSFEDGTGHVIGHSWPICRLLERQASCRMSLSSASMRRWRRSLLTAGRL